MKQSKGPLITGLLLAFVLIVGLLVSLFVLIYPTQAGPAVLRTSVNVAATAQAIQAQHRQSELEALAQARQIAWNSEVAAKEQALITFEQDALAETDQLRSELGELQTQIDQVRLDIEETQQQILTLRQTIEEERASNQNDVIALEQEMTQIEGELQAELTLTQATLQAARDELAKSQAAVVDNGEGSEGEAPASSDDESSEDESDDDGRDEEDRQEDESDDKDEPDEKDEKDEDDDKDEKDEDDDKDED